MNAKKTLITTNRRLENYLYIIGIDAIRHWKMWDDMTAWEYEDTPELRQAVEEYRLIPTRKERMQRAGGGL